MQGLCERIGIEGSKITHKANGGEWEQEVPFPTHTEAFMKVVEMMTSGEGAVVKDKSEISAIGHRVVQGAEFFTKSEIVTDAIIDKIEEIAPLAPVHNMAGLWRGPRAARPGRVKREGPPRCLILPPLPPDHAQKACMTACRMRCRKMFHPPLRRPWHQPPLCEHGRRPVPERFRPENGHLPSGQRQLHQCRERRQMCGHQHGPHPRWPAC